MTILTNEHSFSASHEGAAENFDIPVGHLSVKVLVRIYSGRIRVLESPLLRVLSSIILETSARCKSWQFVHCNDVR